MRARSTLVLVVVLVVRVMIAAPAGADDVDTWIVTMSPEPDVYRAASTFDGVEIEQVFSHVMSGMVIRGTAEDAARLAADERVLRVEIDREFSALDTPPSGLSRISGVVAHEAGFTGSGSRVAILDTGIDAEHPDLSANINDAENLNCIAPGTPPTDDHGHGTAVAGIVGAESNGFGSVGVAPEASLTVVKVLASTGNGSSSQIICGLDHVAGLAADGIPTVVNLSLGSAFFEAPGCGSSALHQAICNLTMMGIPVIAAAGNDGIDAVSTYPAAYPETIAVSALADLDGTRARTGCAGDECDETISTFSNYGSVIDVAAPGVLVTTTVMGSGSYGQFSGTSAAAPHAAAVAAIALVEDPSLSVDDLRLLLRQTGECPDQDSAGPSVCVAKGMWQKSVAGSAPIADPDGIAEPLVNAFDAAREAVRPFRDVHVYEWWFEAIESVSAASMVGGYADGSYIPNGSTTRAEFVAILARGLGETSVPPPADPYPDVARSSWYAGYVDRLTDLEVIAGYADGSFRPDAPVSRAEAAALLMRALGESEPPPPLSPPFDDVPTESWFAPFVQRLADLGIITGYADGTFRPETNVTRAESAVLASRAFLGS